MVQLGRHAVSAFGGAAAHSFAALLVSIAAVHRRLHQRTRAANGSMPVPWSHRHLIHHFPPMRVWARRTWLATQLIERCSCTTPDLDGLTVPTIPRTQIRVPVVEGLPTTAGYISLYRHTRGIFGSVAVA